MNHAPQVMTMGKELHGPGKGSQIADEMVTNKTIDKTPGRATRDEGDVPSFNLMSPKERAEMQDNTKHRITAAGGYCNAGAESAKMFIIMEKPKALPMWMGFLIEIAADFAGEAISKAIVGLRSGRISFHSTRAHDAMMGGHYDAADNADSARQVWQSISEASISKRVRMVIATAKFQAFPALTAFLADSQGKAEKVNYIAKLQMGLSVAFQVIREEVVKDCSDPELVALFHAFDAIHHQSETYARSIVAKASRYTQSGVDRIGKDREIIEDGGKRDWIGDLDIDRRVAWVKDPSGEKALWYYEAAQSKSNARSHEIALSKGHNGTFKVTKPVPREFWGEALTKNEQETGEQPKELEDSPETRAALGVPKNYASSMSAAKVSSAQTGQQKQQDDGAVAAHGVYNRLFGGMGSSK